jgi:hypothetical protein
MVEVEAFEVDKEGVDAFGAVIQRWRGLEGGADLIVEAARQQVAYGDEVATLTERRVIFGKKVVVS